MKMDMSAKKTDPEISPTQHGEYSQEELDDMLEDFIRAKKIESDPTLLQLLRDYALSKNKMVDELFDVNNDKPAFKPKSLADLKKKKAEIDKQESKPAEEKHSEEEE